MLGQRNVDAESFVGLYRMYFDAVSSGNPTVGEPFRDVSRIDVISVFTEKVSHSGGNGFDMEIWEANQIVNPYNFNETEKWDFVKRWPASFFMPDGTTERYRWWQEPTDPKARPVYQQSLATLRPKFLVDGKPMIIPQVRVIYDGADPTTLVHTFGAWLRVWRQEDA